MYCHVMRITEIIISGRCEGRSIEDVSFDISKSSGFFELPISTTVKGLAFFGRDMEGNEGIGHDGKECDAELKKREKYVERSIFGKWPFLLFH